MKHGAMLYPRTTAARRVMELNGLWKFRMDVEEAGDSQGWIRGIPDGDWIPVPASFNDFYTDKDAREFTGDYWYEKEVWIPSEWKKFRLFLRFAAVTHRAEVFVNGRKVAEHEGGFLPFSGAIDHVVKWDEPNRIVVKGNNELRLTSLPAGTVQILNSGKKMNRPFFDFFNYAGIHRPVVLMAVPEERILDYTVRHRLGERAAFVDYQVKTTGKHPVELTLYDQEGRIAARASGKQGTLTVHCPHLWEVRNAYLYRLVIRIQDGPVLVDEYQDEIGIRTFGIEGNQLLLNGHPVYLKGFGKHEDSDVMGRGYHPGCMKRDFELMKWMGANSFRTSHYPYSEEMYQMADREGFLVIDEVAAVGFSESVESFLDAVNGKVTGFFDQPTLPLLKQHHLCALEEMITRDKNHACVIAWSLFNEPDSGHEKAFPYFQEVFAKARALDIQARPCTFAMELKSSPDLCRCYSLCDFLSLNRYYGWYLLGGYELEEAETALRNELDQWIQKGISCPIIFTEYGCDHLVGEHKLPSVQWCEEYAGEYLEMYHRVFDSYACICGEQVWNFADFQTGEGIYRVNGNRKGIFTRQRQPKASAYLIRKRWKSLPSDFKGQKKGEWECTAVIADRC